MTSKGRPRGSGRSIPILASDQTRTAIENARRLGKFAPRAELLLALSIEVGLRASELPSLTLGDTYEDNGHVREAIYIKPAYSRSDTRCEVKLPLFVRRLLVKQLQSNHFRYDGSLKHLALFASTRGDHLSPASIARFLIHLYNQAGLKGFTSRSGRKTLIARLKKQDGFAAHLLPADF